MFDTVYFYTHIFPPCRDVAHPTAQFRGPPGWCTHIFFVTGFPKSKRGNDAIFVVIDKLTKVAHFLPIRESITVAQLAELYTSRIVSLHGIPQLISSDRGSIFTSMFWDSFQKAMGPIFASAQPFILKPVAKLSESIKFLKICSGHVSSLLV